MNDDFVSLLRQAASLKSNLDIRSTLYLHALACRPHDKQLAQRVRSRLDTAAVKEMVRNLPFITPAMMAGSFLLGYHQSGKALIEPIELSNHLLLLSGSGGGKTINFFFWLQQVISTTPVWIFDFFKREYRRLSAAAYQLGHEVFVLRWQRFPFNPLRVPTNVHPSEWINNLVDVLASTLAVPPVARNILRVALTALYRKRGIFDGSNDYPVWKELIEHIESMKVSKPAKQALLDRLETLLAVAGDMLSYRIGFPTENLEGQRVIFEMDGLGRMYQDFYTALLLTAAFTRRVATGGNLAPLVVTLDEGHRLYSKRLESGPEGPSTITTMTSLVRAEKMFLLVGVQSTHDLAHSIQSNSSTKLLGRCGTQEDYVRMGRSMGLTREQIEWCKFHLKPGLFVAKLNYGKNLTPFLLNVPMVDVPQTLSDAEVDASTQRLILAIGWKGNRVETPTIKTSAKPEARTSDKLTSDEEAFLRCVREHLYLTSSEYAPLVGISQRKALALRKQLCRKGYLEEWPLDTEHGGRIIVLIPKKEGNGHDHD